MAGSNIYPATVSNHVWFDSNNTEGTTDNKDTLAEFNNAEGTTAESEASCGYGFLK